eukprot:TRINITY_DN4818_c0_g1_i1.p1 TRINITY_DN4818_c0_g1~~TRINITY_DN4818_c0_g1_i1.p1  ORF type:complete len:234 (+),score=17.99 TRINITY_DN4818_c0_g1_i1:52-753(+)
MASVVTDATKQAVFTAVQTGDVETLARLLQNELKNEEIPAEDYMTPLGMALQARCNRSELVHLMLSHPPPASIHDRDYCGSSIALSLVENPDPALFRVFLDKGLDVNNSDKYENSYFLSLAVKRNVTEEKVLEMMQLLFEFGANPNQRSYRHHQFLSPLGSVIKRTKSVACVRLLLDKGARVTEEEVDIARELLPADYAKEILAILEDALRSQPVEPVQVPRTPCRQTPTLFE